MSLRRFLHRRQWDAERARELEAHLAHEIDDNVSRGLSPEAARRRAYIRLGNPTQIREEIWKMNSLVSIEDLGRDLRYAVRQLLRSPGFACVAIVTLALGIGVNTAIFSMVNGLLFSSLHIEQQSRVQQIGIRQQDQPWQPMLSLPELRLVSAATKPVFSDVFGEQYGLDGLSMEGSKPDRVFTDYVTGNFFAGLGVKPLLGRFFQPSEGITPGADPCVVLSYEYWKEHFGGDGNIVGRKVALDSVPVTVIGVAPADYRSLSSILRIQAYLPLAMTVPIENTLVTDFNKQSYRNLRVYGRLRAGVTPQQGDAALAVAAQQLAAAYPAEEKNAGLRVFSLEAGRLTGGLDSSDSLNTVSAIFMGLASLVLLLACVNVTNLLLVRATVHEREMVIRSALGAQRSRLIRQTMTESLLLALLGGAGGVLLGRLGSGLLSSVNLESDLPIHFDFGFDWHVLAFSLSVAILAGLVVGIVPAVRLARANLNLVLREGGRGIAGRGHKFRDALVTAQVAAALLLLIVAGLFTRTLAQSEHADLGFDPNHVLVMMVDPSEIGYDSARSAQFYRTLLPRLRALPGVVSATMAGSIPMGIIDVGSDTVTIDGYTPPPGQAPPPVAYNLIGTDYFQTLRIPLKQGRAFSDADAAGSLPVAIVSRAMADKYWPHQDPVGRRFKLSFDPKPVQIVGVAGDARYGTLSGGLDAYFYVPYAQHSDNNTLLALELRTQGDPAAMIPEIERGIHGVAPALPVFEVKTLHQALYTPNGLLLFQVVAVLAGVMGTLGLVLAIVGVYGVLSYVVSQKTGEIGVRMALGAQRGDILRIVFRQGLWIVGIGLAVGLAASFGAARLVHSMITVSPADPVTYVGVSAALTAIAMLACYIPARRAMLVDPMQALRQE
ncbi:MAG TPA: ABC transporter permease [Acidobacteriaceae bacterium]|jgi:predicted permease|nr:ABC transporter permease [Acidobacteriaceae bacterium]